MRNDGIPDLFIEKLLLDELPPEQKARLLRDPSVRSRLQERLEELEADNRRILEQYPAELMAERIRRKAGQGKRRAPRVENGRRRFQRPRRRVRFPRLSWPKLVPAAGFATLLLVAGLLLVTRGPAILGPGDSDVRLKGGGPHLNVYLQGESGAELLEEGDRLGQGDTVQVGYVPGDFEYGAILSIDGRGTVTLHFPLSAVTGQNLEGEGEVLLPFAYTLDDAPLFERFFFVFSQRSFDLQAVLGAAEKLADTPQEAKVEDLKLPRGLEQSSILLLK
jgi:hypothetical protein